MLLLHVLSFSPFILSNPATVFLDEAKRLMSNGKFQDALLNYEKAIEADPKNHMTYFRRAAAYLILGKNEQAIRDFDSVLELKSDNQPVILINKARLKRAKLLLYQGSIEQALDDLKIYLKHHPSDEEAIELSGKCQEAKVSWDKIKSGNQCDLDSLNTLIQHCPKYVGMLEKRAQCHLEQSQVEMAIGDLSRAVKLSPNSNHISLQLSTLYSSIGELDRANTAIKECLRQDPEHRACKKQFRKVKGIQKQFVALQKLQKKKKWSAILSTLFKEEKFVEEMEQLGARPLLKDTFMLACEAYHYTKKHKDAIQFCSKVLDIQEEFLEARILRAESYMATDELEKAKNDFQTAHESDRQNQRIVEGYRKAEALLKRAGMKDYYKILGVSRSASQKEIKKAYRKKAQEWHPDKYSGDLPKEEVEKKMADINAAYEVIGNEETREKYDQGHDPNDPNAQQQGHNPFEGFHGFQGFPGFQGFAGGGQQFHFKFN